MGGFLFFTWPFMRFPIFQSARRHLLLSLGAFLLGACGGGSTDTDDAAPTLVSAADLVQRAGYPGALTVQANAQSVTIQQAGLSRPNEGLRPGDWLSVGSLSKSFTASLAGVLVQEGRLRWDSKLLEVLPELRDSARSEYAGVNLQDLLAHRSGIYPATTSDQIAKLPPLSGSLPEQRLQLGAWALQQPAVAIPGKALAYSNGGYVLAAAMLERAGGTSFESLLDSRLLRPLGIEARYGPLGLAEAWGHVRNADGRSWRAIDPADPNFAFPAVANPAGGLKLTAAGVGRYLQMHLRALQGLGGEPISAATAKTLHTALQADHALGWMLGRDLKDRPLSFHAGSDDASYYALMAVSPGANAAVLVFSNGFGPNSEADLSQVAVRLLP